MPSRTDELSDEEIELRLELLKRQRERGTAPRVQVTLPAEPGAAPTVTRLSGRGTKTPIEDRWFNTTKVCAHCGKEKNVGKDFGIVVARGVQYANSWCSQCRSETSNSYRTAPRKNKSKHNPKPDRPMKKLKK